MGDGFGANELCGIALSGGPDSLALLLLAHAALPKRVIAATVDHGLRAESADEARFCADICGQLGIPHTVLTVKVASGNLQASARNARYNALSAWCADNGAATLMTAHHADDQAETLLMRLNRGSGLSGLAGVRRDAAIPGSGVRLLRPLLGWRKVDLEAIVSFAGITPMRDPSNEDDRFDRARIRKALAQADWLDPVQIAASAQHLQEAEQFVAMAVNGVWDACVVTSDEGISIHHSRIENRFIAVNVVQRAMAELRVTDGSNRPALSDAARLLKMLEQGKGGNVAGVWGVTKGDNWWLRREPRRNHS